MKLLIALLAVAGLGGCAAYVPYDSSAAYGYPGYGASYPAYGAGYPAYGAGYPAYGAYGAPAYPYYGGGSVFYGTTVVTPAYSQRRDWREHREGDRSRWERRDRSGQQHERRAPAPAPAPGWSGPSDHSGHHDDGTRNP